MSDCAQVEIFSYNDQHHGKEDEQNADDETWSQCLAKDDHTDGHRRERLKGTQDGVGVAPT